MRLRLSFLVATSFMFPLSSRSCRLEKGSNNVRRLQRAFSTFASEGQQRDLRRHHSSFGRVDRKSVAASQPYPISGRWSMSSSSDTDPVASSRARVALLQFPVSSDKKVNYSTARDFVERAVSDKGGDTKLLVLPEIWNSPYATAAFPDYAEVLPEVGTTLSDLERDSSFGASSRLLMELAAENKVWMVGGSIPELDQSGRVYNTCLCIDPSGTIVAKHRKVHLFDISVPGGITFRESDTLSAGQKPTFFDIPDIGRIGVGICYDVRFPEYALLLSQKFGCRVLVYPGAFNMTTGPAHWELLMRARAVDNQCYVLAASPSRVVNPETDGKYPHYTAWGHSMVVTPWGELESAADETAQIVFADLDMAKVANMRQSIPTMDQKRKDIYQLVDGTR